MLYDLVAGFHVRSEFGQCLLNHAGDMVRREKKKKQSNRQKKKVQAKNLLKSKLVIIFVSLVLKKFKTRLFKFVQFYLTISINIIYFTIYCSIRYCLPKENSAREVIIKCATVDLVMAITNINIKVINLVSMSYVRVQSIVEYHQFGTFGTLARPKFWIIELYLAWSPNLLG